MWSMRRPSREHVVSMYAWSIYNLTVTKTCGQYGIDKLTYGAIRMFSALSTVPSSHAYWSRNDNFDHKWSSVIYLRQRHSLIRYHLRMSD